MSTISNAVNKKKQDKTPAEKSLADEYPALLDKKRDNRKLWAILLLVIALVCGVGGGFLLLFVEPELLQKVRQKLEKLLYVPFGFENLGSQIIYYAPEQNH